MVLSRLKFLPLLVLLVGGPMGCAILPPNNGHDSFADYAESVFRHQNELNSRLMMLSEAEQLPDDDAFEAAEEAMHDACHLLNEYAERESSGESMGFWFKSKVQASINACNESIRRLESMPCLAEKLKK